MIIRNPNNLPLINYKNLVNLQNDSFKDLTKERFDKLCASFKRHGFFVPFYVWINKGVYYVLDGHQRLRALHEIESDGLELPYITIEAKNKKDAAEKLLAIDGKYGQRTLEGQDEFIELFEIDQEYLDDVAVLEFQYEEIEEEEKPVEEKEPSFSILLEYTEDEFNMVNNAINRIGGTPEKVLFELLGLEN